LTLYNTPALALKEALKNGLTKELEDIIFKEPYETYILAVKMPQLDPNRLLDIACSSWYSRYIAVSFAANVPGVDLNKCQSYACCHPQVAFDFWESIPSANISKLAKVIIRNKLPTKYMIESCKQKDILDKLRKEPGWDIKINEYIIKKDEKHKLDTFKMVLTYEVNKMYDSILQEYKKHGNVDNFDNKKIMNLAKSFSKDLKSSYPRVLNEIMIRKIIK